MYSVTREQILTALQQALEPLDYVHAMWQGGAAAFGRVDEWSDIDLQVDVDDERVADVVATAEQTLRSLSPVEIKFEVPQPTWHGHWQAFYRLRDTSEFLLLDFVVMKHNNPNKFLQPETHGNAVVHFDKSGVVQTGPLDMADLAAQLEGRVRTLRTTFPLFQSLTLKELNRRNDIEALTFYHGFTLRPLVEVLRIKHQPARSNFYARYVYYDLPAEVVRRLEELFFVRDAAELLQKREQAEQWFWETLDQGDS